MHATSISICGVDARPECVQMKINKGNGARKQGKSGQPNRKKNVLGRLVKYSSLAAGGSTHTLTLCHFDFHSHQGN